MGEPKMEYDSQKYFQDANRHEKELVELRARQKEEIQPQIELAHEEALVANELGDQNKETARHKFLDRVDYLSIVDLANEIREASNKKNWPNGNREQSLAEIKEKFNKLRTCMIDGDEANREVTFLDATGNEEVFNAEELLLAELDKELRKKEFFSGEKNMAYSILRECGEWGWHPNVKL